MDNTSLQNELIKLKRSHARTKQLYLGSLLLMVIAIVTVSFTKLNRFDLIRAKGIIIEDANGKDRILIGAPVPFSKNRVRTDTALVRKHWASQFDDPNQYMGWYKKYKNSSNGIIFMNEEGFDEVLIGENLADANVGVRMYEISGILFNNKKGWERGGAGVNTSADGKTRQGVGFDDESGEAMHMVTLEDGSKALIIADEKGSLRIGMSQKPGELFQNKESFTGIKYFNNKGKLVWEQQMKP
ncbi:hypothetical protein GCM10027036_08310 [Flavihumibacter cheonanensis]|uniref:hypothetical protein n=1 Tax=Flavihumibacter cheonanensis TaxID=1442385 RepID=UPI001EF97666|nr:hypothetical protein [Flavihumibacter cheonanensis]MCG7751729.1 hypothetical protein [Flavihumibacter cheonanensis]